MGKKKNSKTVIATIIITLVVLALLSYAGVKFLLPIYVNSHPVASDAVMDIYTIAVKLFPLLIGIVLIIIASMIATAKDDVEDEDDKLPPNSYDDALFSTPADDPSTVGTESTNKVEPEFTEEEEQNFISIFDAPNEPVEDEEPAVEETTDEVEDEVEEELSEEEFESDIFDDEIFEDEEDDVFTSPSATPSSASTSKDDRLVDAIYALVNKIDESMTYSDSYYVPEMEDEDLEDFDEAEEDFTELEGTEDSSSLKGLEDKIDRLCSVVLDLAQVIKTRPVETVTVTAPAPAPVAAPAAEPVKEEDHSGDEVLVDESNETYANEVERFAKLEFGSSRDGAYDISYAMVDAPLSDVQLLLAGLGDAFSVKDKTLVVVPFLSNEEIKAELDKNELKYDLKTVSGDEDADFEEVIGKELK